MDNGYIGMANNFMGENAYEQYEINESLKPVTEEVVEEEVVDTDEDQLEVAVVDDQDAELESGEDYESEEETEEEEIQFSYDEVSNAIQLVIDGEADTAVEALEIAQAEEYNSLGIKQPEKQRQYFITNQYA